MNTEMSIPLAFVGGFLSFVSPCVLPLIPSYISFLTGISFEELSNEETANSSEIKRIILMNSVMFVLGFSTLFVVVLGSTAQLLGAAFIEYQDILRKIGGVVIVILGIHIMGVINIGVLHRDKKVHIFKDKPAGFLGSFLVGIGFAAGWTPCIGPILSAIFAVAAVSDNPWSGIILFIAYSAGLAIPFLLTALGISSFLKHFKKLKKHMGAVSIVTGSLLIVTGVLIFFDSFAMISSYFSWFQELG